MTETAVEFRSVRKRYGPIAAVDGVSFSIERGTLVTLLGPSGCGMTTTLRLVAGLEQATSGQIIIGGADVTHLSAAERDVSMVFQSYALFPHMTVLENVCYGLRASGMKRPAAEAAEAAAADKLGKVGLAGFERRLPSELSGGQQQRVAVARAIVLEPQVLLFDEPLSNLDAMLRRQVRGDIRALQQDLGLTVVYVTHDQEEALAVSDRIVVMHSARIVQDGTPRKLYEQPANAFIANFIGNANLVPVTLGPEDQVQVGRSVLHLPHRSLPPGPARLAIRPNGFTLHETALHTTRDSGQIIGRIQKAAYLGGHMEYEVILDDIPGTVLVTDSNVTTPFPPGTSVIVRIQPGAAALVPA